MPRNGDAKISADRCPQSREVLIKLDGVVVRRVGPDEPMPTWEEVRASIDIVSDVDYIRAQPSIYPEAVHRGF